MALSLCPRFAAKPLILQLSSCSNSSCRAIASYRSTPTISSGASAPSTALRNNSRERIKHRTKNLVTENFCQQIFVRSSGEKKFLLLASQIAVCAHYLGVVHIYCSFQVVRSVPALDLPRLTELTDKQLLKAYISSQDNGRLPNWFRDIAACSNASAGESWQRTGRGRCRSSRIHGARQTSAVNCMAVMYCQLALRYGMAHRQSRIETTQEISKTRHRHGNGSSIPFKPTRIGGLRTRTLSTDFRDCRLVIGQPSSCVTSKASRASKRHWNLV